jgi:hypothetical protein
MNLNKHMNDGLKRSLKILKAIKIPKCSVDDVYVGTYANGRENGLCIKVCKPDFSSHYFVFAEARGSDSMVLYEGPSEGFDSDNSPHEFAWKQATYFSDEATLVRVLEKSITKLLKTLGIKEAA